LKPSHQLSRLFGYQVGISDGVGFGQCSDLEF
jgi:hypothetical protein